MVLGDWGLTTNANMLVFADQEYALSVRKLPEQEDWH